MPKRAFSNHVILANSGAEGFSFDAGGNAALAVAGHTIPIVGQQPKQIFVAVPVRPGPREHAVPDALIDSPNDKLKG